MNQYKVHRLLLYRDDHWACCDSSCDLYDDHDQVVHPINMFDMKLMKSDSDNHFVNSAIENITQLINDSELMYRYIWHGQSQCVQGQHIIMVFRAVNMLFV